MATIYETELPGAFFDALIEDPVPAVLGATPTLVNLDPERGEDGIARGTNIAIDITTIAPTGSIDLSTVLVYVAGVPAFDAGTFQTGFTGAASGYSNPQPDTLRVVIDPTVDFNSQATVVVRVVARAVGDLGALDTTYFFSVGDTTPPQVVLVEAIDLKRIRVTFSETVLQGSTSNADSAANPANYTLERFGDYLKPLVSATVAAVDTSFGGLDSVDLITNIPLTPGGTYQLVAANFKDVNGNEIGYPFNTFTFVGWQPPVPEGRDFDLYKKLPQWNRNEDATLDLYRFVACLQEVADLLLYDIDKFIEVLDPDTAPEDFVDAMLADLGNPFSFELALGDKRRLAQVLVDMYRLKGTSLGIQAVIRFFLSLEVAVDPFNGAAGSWYLGEGELGVTSILGTNDPALLYSFSVTAFVALTAVQRFQLRSIVEYMKPAHTHFVKLFEPFIPLVLDHMELGLSELGENWYLH